MPQHVVSAGSSSLRHHGPFHDKLLIYMYHHGDGTLTGAPSVKPNKNLKCVEPLQKLRASFG